MKSSIHAPILIDNKDIKADGKYRVFFELSGGNADFPFIASDYHLTIEPAETGKEDWVNGASDRCGYGNVAGDWNPDGAKAAERWWFKA